MSPDPDRPQRPHRGSRLPPEPEDSEREPPRVRRGSGGQQWSGALIGGGAVALVAAVVLVIVALTSSGSSRPVPVVTSLTAPSSTTTTATSTPAPRVTLAPAKPAPRTEVYGASVNLLFNGVAISPALVGAQLNALRAAGGTIARSDAFWEATEPKPPVDGVHHFVWQFDDHVVGTLAAHGLQWLPILDYSAPWAQSIPGNDHSAPRSDTAYAGYARAFAARYGPGGTFWRTHRKLPDMPVRTFEIWNEPDGNVFWLPHADPAGYADLYMTARAAIDAVDPSARVIVGGLTNAGEFLPQMLIARPQLRGHIDGVAIHPYGIPSIAFTRIQNARSTLVSLGMPTVPIYVTEFGWTTTPPGALDYVPAASRPAYISSTVAGLGHNNCGVVAATIYTWYSSEQNPADSQQWYGINGVNGQPTPSSQAFAQGVSRAEAPAKAFKLCSTP